MSGISSPLHYSLALALLLTPMALLARKSPEARGGSPAKSVVIPGKGSSYTYRWLELDSTGKVTTEYRYTARVQAGRVAVEGHHDSPAIQVTTQSDTVNHNSFGQSIPITYLYLADGDLLMLHPQLGNRPLLLPFGTGKAPEPLQVDTAVTRGRQTTHISFAITASFQGSDTVVVAGKPLQCRKVTTTATKSIGGRIEATFVDSYWYAPEIGFMAREEHRISWPATELGAASYHAVATLGSYLLAR
jgi:hypothetical protein